jgi:hypothetical protein
MLVMTAFAFFSSVCSLWCRDDREVVCNDEENTGSVWLALRFVLKERRMQLIFPFALARGMYGTLESYYFNGVIVAESVGAANIGYFSAVPVLVAFALAGPVTYAAGEVGKLPLMCYCLVSQIMVCTVLYGLSQADLIALGWQVVFLYAMNGVALVVDTCLYRAIVVDFFPGQHAEGFSSIVIADAIGNMIPLALFPLFSKNLLVGSTWLISLLAIPAINHAYSLHNDPERKSLRSNVEVARA